MWSYQYPSYLSHGGPGSGRYPAGSGKRPWQHRGIRGYIAKRRAIKKEKKQLKQYDQNREKLKTLKEQKAAKEKDKISAVTEGNASKVLRYKNEMSNEELRYALERVRMTTELEKYSKPELSKAQLRMDSAVRKVNQINTYAEAGIRLAKNAEAIYIMMDRYSKQKNKKVN